MGGMMTQIENSTAINEWSRAMIESYYIEFLAKFYSYLSTIATLTINYVISYVYVIDSIKIESVNRFS